MVGCYANKITGKVHTIAELKELLFGTQESFEYKIAIIDANNKLLYSSFEVTPEYNLSQITYSKDDKVFYNSIKYFQDAGDVKVIFEKKIDYSQIKKKSIIIVSCCFLFLIGCSFFLYYHLKKIYANITKKIDIFFKDAIHEIRTPLGVLQINLDFLENTNESSMPLKRAQGGVRNLTSIYESLEYFIKNKKIKYKKESINMSQFLKNRIDFFKVLGEIKDVALEYDIEEDIFIHISRIELQRLIDNNLSNAIKYSSNNSKIKIALYHKNGFLHLEFSNYGDMIQDIDKIFQRYYRGDNIRGGFGLGLNIVEYICNLYGILIKVTSTQEGYTTFLYTIPQKNLQRNSK
jgi:hypothetical protein